MSRFDLGPGEITSAPLYRVLPVLAAPLLLQNLVVIAQRLVDLFWVGRIGGDAVAAVALTIPVAALANVLIVGPAYFGAQILHSQRVGADDPERARRATFNAVVLGLVLGVVVGGAVWLLAPRLVGLVTALRPATEGEGARRLATAYLRVVVWSNLAAVAGDAVEASLVARGDSRGALYLTGASVAANVVLDPVLLFGVGPVPRLGFEGVALATVLASGVATAVAAGFVARGRRGGVLSRSAAVLDRADLREMVGVAWPPTLQRANQYVADLLVTVVVFAAGGVGGVAAYIVGTQFFSVALVPSLGVQGAAQSVVGQNLGADEPDRAARTGPVGTLFLAGLLVPVAAAQYLAAGHVVDLLAPGLGPDASAHAVTFLRIFAVSYPAVGAVYALQGTFNGASRSRVSFYASVFQYWVVQLPVAAAVGLVFASDLVLVFWSVAGAKVAAGAALVAYFAFARRRGVFETAAAEVEEAPGD